ncbi:MAG: hypothetical protein KDJ69_08305 [Nitratireductor sp.]|nr:hypothetical protein [Nitratireductor sp.]
MMKYLRSFAGWVIIAGILTALPGGGEAGTITFTGTVPPRSGVSILPSEGRVHTFTDSVGFAFSVSNGKRDPLIFEIVVRDGSTGEIVKTNLASRTFRLTSGETGRMNLIAGMPDLEERRFEICLHHHKRVNSIICVNYLATRIV